MIPRPGDHARHEITVLRLPAATAAPGPAQSWGLPTGAEKARWLIGYIESTWTALGHPGTERAVEHALACATRRAEAHDDERAVLTHGDVHQWNVLEAPHGGFKLVDPDGLIAEAEYNGVLPDLL